MIEYETYPRTALGRDENSTQPLIAGHAVSGGANAVCSLVNTSHVKEFTDFMYARLKSLKDLM